MIKNYLKSAWRSMVKNKMTSFVNICGLSVGMAVAILIGLWITDELSFNKYHKNYDTIAQLARKDGSNGEYFISENSNNFPMPLAAELRTNYGNYFSHVALASANNEHVLTFNNNQFANKGMYVEPDFTSIFTLKMTSGTYAGFNEPYAILINQSLARSLFGNEEATGKLIKMDNSQTLKVLGVYEDMPHNSKFEDVSFFIPWSLLLATNEFVRTKLVNDWGNSSSLIFVRSAPNVSMEQVSNAIKEVYWSNIKSSLPASSDYSVSLFLHPMKDWHLRSEWKNGVQAGGK